MSEIGESNPSAAAGGFFPVTQWSLVLRAARENERGDVGRGLETLCTRYRPAVVAFLRVKLPPAEVEDVAQNFFLSLLQHQSLTTVTPEQGRFRAFLKGCLQHHVGDHWRRHMTQKRGGGQLHISMDDADGGALAEASQIDWSTPSLAFDRAWFQTLMSRVLSRLREECAGRGAEERFLAVQPWLMGEADVGEQAAVAQRLGLNLDTLRSFIHRLKLRLRELIKEEVSETLEHGADVESELKLLMTQSR